MTLCHSYRGMGFLTHSISVSLFLMHIHSFEHIWTKFGMWYPYTIRMVMGQLASIDRAPRFALHAPSIYAAANGW